MTTMTTRPINVEVLAIAIKVTNEDVFLKTLLKYMSFMKTLKIYFKHLMRKYF